jgi:hypothetical protein
MGPSLGWREGTLDRRRRTISIENSKAAAVVAFPSIPIFVFATFITATARSDQHRVVAAVRTG